MKLIHGEIKVFPHKLENTCEPSPVCSLLYKAVIRHSAAFSKAVMTMVTR